jgi:hypothetical protein
VGGAAGAWVVEDLRKPVSRLPSDISFVSAAGGLFGIDYPRLVTQEQSRMGREKYKA